VPGGEGENDMALRARSAYPALPRRRFGPDVSSGMPSPSVMTGSAAPAFAPLERLRGLLPAAVVVAVAGVVVSAAVTGDSGAMCGAVVGAVAVPEAVMNGEGGGAGRKGFSCQM